jgi:hypothetical protein
VSAPVHIRITEVGPRDGLQNESSVISVDAKVAFVDLLSDTGVTEIEVSSFVSKKWIPQLGDAAEVFARIKRKQGVVYSALVPNMQGLEAALQSKVDKIALFTGAAKLAGKEGDNFRIKVFGDRGAGTGERALGDPLNVLVWLANRQSLRGRGLRAGEIISTSSIRISCVVRAADVERAVQVIHDRFRLSDEVVYRETEGAPAP